LLERDLPALLNSVASSVRAGIDPLRALTDAGEYLPAGSPLIAELASFKKALSSGVDEVEALESLFRGEDHPDLELFTRCLILSRRHGSALSEPLHRITRVVRQRQSFRRKTRAALAMHRMSALGIAVCAIFIGGLQFVTNAAGVRIAIESRVGAWLVAGGVTLVAIGVMWMLMMGREERL
jgi:Flp pilus assembly protein TadB